MDKQVERETKHISHHLHQPILEEVLEDLMDLDQAELLETVALELQSSDIQLVKDGVTKWHTLLR